MYKISFALNGKVVSSQAIELIKELEDKGFLHNDGFLYYEESDKECLSEIFSKYGKSFY